MKNIFDEIFSRLGYYPKQVPKQFQPSRMLSCGATKDWIKNYANDEDSVEEKIHELKNNVLKAASGYIEITRKKRKIEARLEVIIPEKDSSC